MKYSGYILLTFILLALGIISCSEEVVGLEELESRIFVKFIDSDSLLTLNDQKADKNSTIANIDARIKEIDAASNKSELVAEKDSLNKVKTGLSAEVTELNKLIANVNNGLAEVTSINSIGPTVKTKALQTLYLNSNDTISRFIIIINRTDNQVLDTLDLVYDLEHQFVENQLRAVASNVSVNFDTYESVVVSCINCLSHDAQLTVYF